MAYERSFASTSTAIAGLIVSVIYLSNITMGVFELPDNLPFVGNLDEVFFSGVLFASLAHLGINLPFGPRHMHVDAKEQGEDPPKQANPK